MLARIERDDGGYIVHENITRYSVNPAQDGEDMPDEPKNVCFVFGDGSTMTLALDDHTIFIMNDSGKTIDKLEDIPIFIPGSKGEADAKKDRDSG